jgi:hypothetical protein
MPPTPPGTRTIRYDFTFAPSYRPAALLFGVMPATAWAELGPEGLRVRFGPWRLQTGLDNIEGAERSGGFGWLKTAGPAHLSFSDRGVTFATNGDDAVCVRFRTPVAGIDPTRLIKHPGATLTVSDPRAFLDQLTSLQR